MAKFSQLAAAAAKNNQISKKAGAQIEQKHTNILSLTNKNISSLTNTNTNTPPQTNANTDIPWQTNVFFLLPHLRFDLAKTDTCVTLLGRDKRKS